MLMTSRNAAVSTDNIQRPSLGDISQAANANEISSKDILGGWVGGWGQGAGGRGSDMFQFSMHPWLDSVFKEIR